MICKSLAGNFLAGVLYVSTKSSKIITKKLQKSYCKLVSKELQYGYSKGKWPCWVWNLFLLVFGDIGHRFSSSGCSPSQSWSMCRTGGIPLRVQKSSSVLDELFCIHKSRKNRLLMRESMTLRHFGGQFACFSAKDIYKVWRGGGLYSGWLCGTVYTINL